MRAPTIAVFTAALALVARVEAFGAGWTTSGPAGVQVVSVSASPTEDGVVYAAGTILEASQSALYRSADAGQSWDPLVEAPRGDVYSEVFADPRDGQRVFASAQRAIGNTQIFRSTDRGEHWSPILTVSTACTPSFAAGAGPDALLLTCGQRLLRTPDAGLTWDEPPTPFTQNVRLTAAPGGAFYAYSTTQIFRSTNGGTSWTPSASAPAACPGLLVLRVDPGNASGFLAGVGLLGAGGFQCGGVYRSANAGASWTASDLSGVYVTDLRFDPSDRSRIFAAASFIAGILPPGGVFRSADGGSHWQDLHLPLPGSNRIAVSAGGGTVHAATTIGVYENRGEHRGRTTRVVQRP